ncbi:MAG TPA: plastocyanin/azurin family copper-binding protein [Acidimicrobiales bacterium]|nr:plastocyanin/azurin family copper-binding protein [Acidimicrobiales bacterium]
MKRMFLIAAVPALLAGAACSSDDDSGGGSADAAPEAPAAAASGSPAVSIETFRFEPPQLTVKVGETVTFTNGDSIHHTATSGTREAKDGRFDLQMPDKGSSATHTFSEAGTFHYFCDRHPGMEGDVIVR